MCVGILFGIYNINGILFGQKKGREKRKILTRATWMELKIIMLNEQSSPRKTNYCVNSLTCWCRKADLTEAESEVVRTGGIRKYYS